MYEIERNRISRTPHALHRSALILIAAFIAISPAYSRLAAHSAQNKKAQVGQPGDARQSAKDEPVRLHADLIVVNATVTDQSGEYAHRLGAKDFTVLEDGVPQSIDSFSAEEAPFAAAILVDMSGSMEYKFSLVRAAAASFIEHIRDDDQVAVYGFNSKINLFQDFSNSRYISDYIWDAKAEDNTRLYDCMDEAIEALAKREEKRRAALLISDGWDSASRKASLDSVMKKAMAAGVTIHTVDLIDDNLMLGSTNQSLLLRRGRKDLQTFAGETGGRYVHSPQGDKIEEAFINIVEELRNQYTLTYYSTNEKRDGKWRKLSVTVSRPGLTTRTRRGYYAPKG